MKTSVVIIPITVIPMPTAQTPMVPSHVLVNLALLAPELLVLVSKVPFTYLIIKSLFSRVIRIIIFLCRL